MYILKSFSPFFFFHVYLSRIISMQSGGDVRGVFDRLARGIAAVGDSVKKESGKDFMLDPKVDM